MSIEVRLALSSNVLCYHRVKLHKLQQESDKTGEAIQFVDLPTSEPRIFSFVFVRIYLLPHGKNSNR